MALTHPLNLEHPVCGYCGQLLKVGNHCLVLQDDDTDEMFDAHAACHAREMAEPDEDGSLSVQ